jgi:hypothetical protein
MMRRLFVLFCIGWTGFCGGAHLPDTLPLALGMTPEDAATALGVGIVRVSEQSDSVIYTTDRDAAVPGYPVGERLFLQFRHGTLTGWKYDWRVMPHWPF